MIVTGYIKSNTGAAVPYASVTITDTSGNSTGVGGTASAGGLFSFYAPDDLPYTHDASYLTVSSVGYKTKYLLLETYRPGITISLEPEAKLLDEVIVYSNKKKFPWVIAGLLALLIINKK